jgi:hypothetical protein
MRRGLPGHDFAARSSLFIACANTLLAHAPQFGKEIEHRVPLARVNYA